MSNLFTLQARRTALLAQLAAVDLKISEAEVTESLAVGETVSFRFGRKPVEILSGSIVAIQDNQVAIQVGEGIDTRIVRVFRAAIAGQGVQEELPLVDTDALPVEALASENI